jgi:hypothetical protein
MAEDRGMGEERKMTMEKRYSGISLQALRRSRIVLSRETDAGSGRPTWIAEMSGTGLRGSGLTRTEALRRVREEAAARHLAFGAATQPTSSTGDSDGVGAAT